MIILNCDYDESQETNGGQLLRRHLARLGVQSILIKNVFLGELPSESELQIAEGVILTGSRASVYEKHDWIQKLAKTVKRLEELEIPTLAICFGFQMVAQTFGGKVKSSGSFREGFKPIHVQTHALFDGFPEEVLVYHSHGDVAVKLPKGTEVLANTPHTVQAFSYKNFWCVQFHPEITVETATAMAERDGKDVKEILNGVKKSYMLPVNVLRNFVKRTKDTTPSLSSSSAMLTQSREYYRK